MKTEVIITEQAPVGKSIFCEIKIKVGERVSIRYTGMYFVCNLERNITQYFTWMKEEEYKNLIEEKGYKF